MFSLNDTLKKSGSVGRWETKQFIGMALLRSNFIATYETLSKHGLDLKILRSTLILFL